MERCPYCGQMARAGARFCTVCGYRIADDATVAVFAATEGAANPADGGNDEASAAGNDGWPAPPAVTDSTSSASWDREDVASEPAGDDDSGEETASVWSAQAGSTWPAHAPHEERAVPGEPANDAPGDGDATDGEARGSELQVAAASAEQATDQRERAERLLDELRGIISEMSGAHPLDLRGVISELEVAVTPPGAIAADDLSALREALLAARERPRDLDTVVDLTGRIDAMVALVFAYDRTIAAIERSLEVLRR